MINTNTNHTQTSPKIDILMATYNGEKFLADQIDSIMKQSYQNIHLYIRDDDSQDNTANIIQQKIKAYPEKITLVPTDLRLGIIGNFSNLMEHSKAQYVMFADQDDIWLPEKIFKSFSKMHELELLHGEQSPLLVHTDLKVVDVNLEVMDSSFWNFTKLHPHNAQTLNRLLIQNVITGCTMMMNRKLVDLAMPIPREVMMHDWWVGLVASAFGAIGIVNEPTMLYRQHGKNQLGAKKEELLPMIRRFFVQPREHIQLITSLLGKQCKQASLLSQAYGEKMSTTQKDTVDAFCNLKDDNFLKKNYSIFKHGFYKNGWLRNMRMFLLLMFIKK